MSDRPTAAPARFPYREHRNMAEVERDQRLAVVHSQYPRYVRNVVVPPTERLR